MTYSYQDALAHYGISGAHPGGLALTKKIIEPFTIQSNWRVLDAGCGTGQSAAYIAKSYLCDVTAVDLHPIMIKKARERFSKEGISITTIEASIEKLPFASNSFDLIIVESVTAFTSMPTSLIELNRVLKKGGILLDLEMTVEQHIEEFDRQTIQRVYGMEDLLTEAEWRDAFQKAGFSNTKIVAGGTVLTELLHSMEKQTPLEQWNPSSPKLELDAILSEHQQLVMYYAEALGYRCFQCLKE
ncbi:class I SAM-dependent methyltransferase [Cytobacillus spongiae]|uniref:class I SAM-dependent methyltransferase n=1 Tax=Cytobacillus spongiae TaxID=2901381 RepID=UPI001F22574F|nr:class I SAM-dependent methyltransferase [Cytobacillus spongiae]UII55847.1 class I SAM-dependent methyltransferase [Cytobacillus spongiae]